MSRFHALAPHSTLPAPGSTRCHLWRTRRAPRPPHRQLASTGARTNVGPSTIDPTPSAPADRRRQAVPMPWARRAARAQENGAHDSVRHILGDRSEQAPGKFRRIPSVLACGPGVERGSMKGSEVTLEALDSTWLRRRAGFGALLVAVGRRSRPKHDQTHEPVPGVVCVPYPA